MKNTFAFPFLAAFAFLILNQVQAISGETVGANAPQRPATVSQVAGSLKIKPVTQKTTVSVQATSRIALKNTSAPISAAHNAKALPAEVVIQGVNTAGSVKMDRPLFSFSSLLNIAVNGFEIAGLAFGLVLLCKTIKPAAASKRIKYAVSGLVLILLAISVPSATNFLVAGSCVGRGDLFH